MSRTCDECGGGLPKAHRLTCSTRRDEVWRVFRFEKADGAYCEVASNHVGPEEVNLPPGYRFICATPLVAQADVARHGAARSVTELPCECENANRIAYTGRDDKLHCEQCDGLWPEGGQDAA